MKAKGKITVRQWQEADIPQIVACHKAVYGDLYEGDELYGRRLYAMQFAAFPEGQFLAEIQGTVGAIHLPGNHGHGYLQYPHLQW